MKTILSADGSAWIIESKLSKELLEYANENFNNLFELHPKKMGRIVMEKEVISKRYHQSFMNSPKLDERFDHNSYMFCGLDQNANNDVPLLFKHFLKYINQIQLLNNKPLYNQVTINWYESGENYIPYHADTEIGMIENNPTICILSLGGELDNKPTRTLKFICKKNTTRRYDFACYNGGLVTMYGKANKDFRHGVAKVDKSSPRISISFRQFK